MKRTSFNTRRLLAKAKLYFRGKTLIVTFAALYLLGVLIGSKVVEWSPKARLAPLESILTAYLGRRSQLDLSANFYSSFFSSTFLLGIVFFLGFCGIAQFVFFLIPLMRGVSFGMIASYFYGSYAGLGVKYIALTVLPNALIVTLVILFACRLAFNISGAVFSTIKKRTVSAVPKLLKKYCFIFLLFECIITLSSLADAGLSKLLGGILR